MADWLAGRPGEPLAIVAGDGPFLIDDAGNRYLDAASSLWCNLHGHRHPVIDAAVRDQLGRIAHSTFLGLTNEPAARLAEQIVGRSPVGPGARVFYSDSGATACEIAAKVAFHYWQLRGQASRTKFVSFRFGYHGDTIGMVSLGGIELFHEIYRPLLFPAVHAPSAYCYRCEFADCPRAGRSMLPLTNPDMPAERAAESPAGGPADYPCLRAVERLLAENRGQVAAIFVEPLIQAAAGIIVSPPGYLAGLQRLAREHDVLLIADEVAVGFGRTGAMFACEHESIQPDILCLAKGISGGYLPLAATVVGPGVFEPFAADGVTFYHGHTYTGNPLACAAGLASLRVFDEQAVLEGLPEKVSRFNDRLAGLARFEHVGDIRGRGLFAGVELVEDRATRRAYVYGDRIGRSVCDAARKRGVFLRPLGDVLVFIPPLCVTVEQIDLMFDAAEAAIGQVLG